MKMIRQNYLRTARREEEGLATVFFIALLAILAMVILANSMALIHLHDEVKLLEQQQIKRLNGTQANSAPLSASNPVQK
jgi:hypothetical protein